LYGVDTKEGGRLGCSSGQADQKGAFGTDATASQPKTRIIICLGGRSSVAQPRLGVHIRSPESLCVQLFSPLPALGRGKEERVSVSVWAARDRSAVPARAPVGRERVPFFSTADHRHHRRHLCTVFCPCLFPFHFLFYIYFLSRGEVLPDSLGVNVDRISRLG